MASPGLNLSTIYDLSLVLSLAIVNASKWRDEHLFDLPPHKPVPIERSLYLNIVHWRIPLIAPPPHHNHRYPDKTLEQMALMLLVFVSTAFFISELLSPGNHTGLCTSNPDFESGTIIGGRSILEICNLEASP